MMPNRDRARQMQKLLRLLCLVPFLAFAQTAAADETVPVARATKEEAVAFVKKAVEYFKANGAEKSMAEFNNPQGAFVDRDMYIVVYDTTGICVAHPIYKKLVGQNRLEEQDSDGTYYVKDRIEKAKKQTTFWTSYRFPDPLTHKIMPKTAYCEVADDPQHKKYILCAGAYNAQP
jgi:cytochrome c